MKVTHVSTAVARDFHTKIAKEEKDAGNNGEKADRLLKILGAILAEAMERNLVAVNVVYQMKKKKDTTDMSTSLNPVSIFRRQPKSTSSLLSLMIPVSCNGAPFF